jgi:hypothetical protein
MMHAAATKVRGDENETRPGGSWRRHTGSSILFDGTIGGSSVPRLFQASSSSSSYTSPGPRNHNTVREV